MAPNDTQVEKTQSRRRTPTEKQVKVLTTLDDGALMFRAIEAMHALNRRAKEIRDRRNRYRRATFAKSLEGQLADIYVLKDKFLDVLVLAGRATVGSFAVRSTSNERVCTGCGRTWFGGPWCYTCDNDSGIAMEEKRTWYIIDCGNGYRFHQPNVSATVAANAVAIPPHDPTQPQREIPKVGLTIEAQRRCVEMAIERLRISTGSKTPGASPPSRPPNTALPPENMEVRP